MASLDLLDGPGVLKGLDFGNYAFKSDGVFATKVWPEITKIASASSHGISSFAAKKVEALTKIATAFKLRHTPGYEGYGPLIRGEGAWGTTFKNEREEILNFLGDATRFEIPILRRFDLDAAGAKRVGDFVACTKTVGCKEVGDKVSANDQGFGQIIDNIEDIEIDNLTLSTEVIAPPGLEGGANLIITGAIRVSGDNGNIQTHLNKLTPTAEDFYEGISQAVRSAPDSGHPNDTITTELTLIVDGTTNIQIPIARKVSDAEIVTERHRRYLLSRAEDESTVTPIPDDDSTITTIPDDDSTIPDDESIITLEPIGAQEIDIISFERVHNLDDFGEVVNTDIIDATNVQIVIDEGLSSEQIIDTTLSGGLTHATDVEDGTESLLIPVADGYLHILDPIDQSDLDSVSSEFD